METGLLNVHREWNVVGVGGGGSTAMTRRMLVLPLVKEDNHFFFLRLCEVIVKTDFKKLIIRYQSNSSLRNSLT